MNNTVADVRMGYDRWSVVYDHDANPLPPLEEPIVHAAIGTVLGLSSLDLGCGTGRHALWLADEGASVIAIDFSEGMLTEARRKPGAERIDFREHDLHQPLPFSDEQFDVIISGLVLEHLEDLPSFFAEAFRVLREGGIAVFSTLHPSMFLRGSQARFTDPATRELILPGSIPHSMSDLVMASLRAGFQIKGMVEVSPDTAFAHRFPRAEKYVGWPMLVIIQLHRAASD